MMIYFCSAGYLKLGECDTHTHTYGCAYTHGLMHTVRHAYKHATIQPLKGAPPHLPLMFLSCSVWSRFPSLCVYPQAWPIQVARCSLFRAANTTALQSLCSHQHHNHMWQIILLFHTPGLKTSNQPANFPPLKFLWPVTAVTLTCNRRFLLGSLSRNISLSYCLICQKKGLIS